jgi:serine/threonine protein kinase
MRQVSLTETVERLQAALADPYAIERELGRGGMATVYLAGDLKHGRQVALKVLKPELAATLGAQRFGRDPGHRQPAARPHPAARRLGDRRRRPLLRHAAGVRESLRDRLEREKLLPVDEAVRIARQVAGALDVTHRQGIIHRDVKRFKQLLKRLNLTGSDAVRSGTQQGAASVHMPRRRRVHRATTFVPQLPFARAFAQCAHGRFTQSRSCFQLPLS